MAEFWNGGGAALILLAALALDALFGEMRPLFRIVPHPVAAVGQLVDGLDRRLNKRGRRGLFWRGLFTALAVAGAAAALGWLIALIPGGWMVELLLVAILLAQRGLYEHVAAVGRVLRSDGLAAGRSAVRHLVSRDPASLDEFGVARSAVESLSENFADGVVAPVFWYAVAGLPGICAYKAINTMDSMIGYRSEKYLAFGKAAARLDDAANWIPARLAGLMTVLAAALTGNNPARALRVILRDASTHTSVNAGWPEAAFSGALGLALGGPRSYPGEGVREHWIGGDGDRRYGPDAIGRALRLYVAACGVNAVLGMGIVLILAKLG